MLSNIHKMLKLSRLRQSNNVCCILTAAIVPLSLAVATISVNSTILTFATIGLSILYARRCTLQSQHRDKDRERAQLFFIWVLTSGLCLMIVFHFFVINLLEILPEENLVLLVLVTACILCYYNTKVKAHAGQLSKASYSGDVESTSEERLISNNPQTFCNFCQANILSKHGHCLWLNCCIGPDNIKHFSIANLLAVLSLIYGSNLTLTTVCHPFIFHNLILLPDDCSEVYMDFNTAISFVCGIYSLIIAMFICLFYIGKIIIKLLNIAGFNNDHRSMRWSGMLGLIFSRPV